MSNLIRFLLAIYFITTLKIAVYFQEQIIIKKKQEKKTSVVYLCLLKDQMDLYNLTAPHIQEKRRKTNKIPLKEKNIKLT